MTITTEQERKNEAIRYVQTRIFELRAEVSMCDWAEDADGNLAWAPGSYPDERRELLAALREWETLLALLIGSVPFNFRD